MALSEGSHVAYEEASSAFEVLILLGHFGLPYTLASSSLIESMAAGLLATGNKAAVVLTSDGSDAARSRQRSLSVSTLMMSCDQAPSFAAYQRARRLRIPLDDPSLKKPVPYWTSALDLHETILKTGYFSSQRPKIVIVYPRDLILLAAGTMLAQSYGAYLCVCSSEAISERTMDPEYIDLYLKMVTDNADIIWAFSPKLASFWLDKHSVSRERLFVSPPLVDQRWAETAESLTQKECSAVFVGNLADTYWNELLAIASRARDEIPDFTLRLFGDYPPALLQERKRELAQRGLERIVELRSAIAREQIPAELRKAQVALIPRGRTIEHEFGFPNKLVEALAVGMPVVVGSSGDIDAYLTSGVDCELVAPEDHGAYVTALKRVLTDRRYAQRLASSGQKQALACFGASNVMKRLLRQVDQEAIRTKVAWQPYGKGFVAYACSRSLKLARFHLGRLFGRQTRVHR